MTDASLGHGVGEAKVAKIPGKTAVSRAQGGKGRANGGPRAISGRRETQLCELIRKLQDKGAHGEVAAEAIYRMWKRGDSPL